MADLLSWLRNVRASMGGKGPVTGTTKEIAAIRHIQSEEIQPRRRFTKFESRLGSLSPERRVEFGMQKKMSLAQYTKGYGSLAQNIVTMWIDAVNNRRAYMALSDEITRYYIVDVILETMVEDVLNPNDRGEIIEFSSDDPAIKKCLDELKKQHDLDNLLVEVTSDLINYGEYTVRLKVDENKRKGVTAICDDVNQTGILAMYERGVPSGFFVYQGNNYKIVPPVEYAHFCVGNIRLRINIDDMLGDTDHQVDWDKVDPEIEAKLPDYVRVGKPFFFKVVAKLRELQILEQLVVVLKLNQITQSKLIGVRVPASMPPDQVAEACREVEEILNTQTGLDITQGQITMAEIITVAGRFKAYPNYSDEKGSLNPMEARADQSVDDLLASCNSIRRIILSSVGIPYSLIFGPEQDGGEGENNHAAELRRFGRYSRKLAGVQRSLAKGVKQIAITHLVNSGFTHATYDSFDVVFKNAMVDLSGLEKLEYDDTKQEIIMRKIDFIEKICANEILRGKLSVEGVFEWLEGSFNDLTGGIPLFNFNLEDEDDELSPEFKDIRDQFLTVAVDGFLQKRKDRELSDGDADAADGIVSKADAFMNRVKRNFQLRIAKRRVPKGDGSKGHDVIHHATKGFLDRLNDNNGQED